MSTPAARAASRSVLPAGAWTVWPLRVKLTEDVGVRLCMGDSIV
jgi:hypothetical protein